MKNSTEAKFSPVVKTRSYFNNKKHVLNQSPQMKKNSPISLKKSNTLNGKKENCLKLVQPDVKTCKKDQAIENFIYNENKNTKSVLQIAGPCKVSSNVHFDQHQECNDLNSIKVYIDNLSKKVESLTKENITLKDNLEVTKNKLEDNMKSLKEVNKDKFIIDLLKPTWLSDDQIGNYFDQLNDRVLGTKSNIHLMSPLIGHAIKSLIDIEHLLTPLNLHDKDIIIIPVNDSMDFYNESGSHWSLLVFNRKLSAFYYYDSLPNKSYEQSKLIANKLLSHLTLTEQVQIKHVSGPLQDNTYDCGIYTILAAEYILSNYNIPDFFLDFSIPPFDYVDCMNKRSLLAFTLTNTCSRVTLQSLIKLSLKSTTSSTSENENKLIKTSSNKNEKPDKNFAEDSNDLELIHNATMDDKLRKEFNKKTHNLNNFVNNLEVIHNTAADISKTRKSPVRSLQKVQIISDSHGRGLAEKLNIHQEKVKYVTTSFVKPGARFLDIINTDCILDKENLILICGGNDTYQCNPQPIYNNLEKFLKKCKGITVHICTIPYRYDLPQNHAINNSILEVNIFLKNTVKKFTNSYIIDLFNLQRHHFTQHGLHMNRKGKIAVCHYILDSIEFASMHKTFKPKSLNHNNLPPLPANEKDSRSKPSSRSESGPRLQLVDKADKDGIPQLSSSPPSQSTTDGHKNLHVSTPLTQSQATTRSRLLSDDGHSDHSGSATPTNFDLFSLASPDSGSIFKGFSTPEICKAQHAKNCQRIGSETVI